VDQVKQQETEETGKNACPTRRRIHCGKRVTCLASDLSANDEQAVDIVLGEREGIVAHRFADGAIDRMLVGLLIQSKTMVPARKRIFS
jgi:hypothetical protein